MKTESANENQVPNEIKAKNLVAENITLVNEEGETAAELLTIGKRTLLVMFDEKNRSIQMVADSNTGEIGFQILDSPNDRYPVNLGLARLDNTPFLHLGDPDKGDAPYLRLAPEQPADAPRPGVMKTFQPLCNVIARLLSDETLNTDSFNSLSVSMTEAQNNHSFNPEQEARMIFPLVLQHIFDDSPVSMQVQVTDRSAPLASFTDDLPTAFERVFDLLESVQKSLPVSQDDLMSQGNYGKVKAIKVLLVSVENPQLKVSIYNKLFTEEYITLEEIFDLFKAVQ